MVCCPYSDDNHDALIRNEEVIKFVDLFSRQIEASIGEALDDISELSQHMFKASKVADNMSAEDVLVEKEYALSLLQNEINKALAKVQFSDRLSQRLLNTVGNLGRLRDLLAMPDDVTDNCWVALMHDVRDSFSMESERKIFDSIFKNTISFDSKSNSGDCVTAVPPELF